MGDDEAGDLGLGDEVPLEPSDGSNIWKRRRQKKKERGQRTRSFSKTTGREKTGGRTQMVRRLIEKKDIGSNEHSSGKLELHLPSSRKGSDGVGLLLVGESNVSESEGDLLSVGVLEVDV